MIPDNIQKLVNELFRTIGFRESKGSDLSVNEFEIITDNTTPLEDYGVHAFVVNALFERNKYKSSILNSDNFKTVLKRNFLYSMDASKTEKKRIKLVLNLQQLSYCS